MNPSINLFFKTFLITTKEDKILFFFKSILSIFLVLLIFEIIFLHKVNTSTFSYAIGFFLLNFFDVFRVLVKNNLKSLIIFQVFSFAISFFILINNFSTEKLTLDLIFFSFPLIVSILHSYLIRALSVKLRLTQ